MYSPKPKTFKTRREKLVSEIVEALELDSFNIESHRKILLDQIKEGKLF